MKYLEILVNAISNLFFLCFIQETLENNLSDKIIQLDLNKNLTSEQEGLNNVLQDEATNTQTVLSSKDYLKNLDESILKNDNDREKLNDNLTRINNLKDELESQTILNGNIIHNIENINIKSKHEYTNLHDDKILAKHDDSLPSFDEWKKKVVEEEQPNNSQNLKNSITNNNKNLIKGSKLKIRNYASSECGAKVIASNKEAQSSFKILIESMDEYMLNYCNSKIWFIIELCEAIKLSSIEIANYELFSSTFNEFSVYGSVHYPTREWNLIGSFKAKDIKQLQEFFFSSQVEFRKFIKIEIFSNHGSEHFCTFSLFRAFGTSMTDEFDALDENINKREESYENYDFLKNNLIEPNTKKSLISPNSVFYKLLQRAAEFFYKNLPEKNRDTKEQNLARFLQDKDTVNAIIEQPLINMMPLLKTKFLTCRNNIKKIKNLQKKTAICTYLQVMLGKTTFDLILNQVQKINSLQFKCPKNMTYENPLKIDVGISKFTEKEIDVLKNEKSEILKPNENSNNLKSESLFTKTKINLEDNLEIVSPTFLSSKSNSIEILPTVDLSSESLNKYETPKLSSSNLLHETNLPNQIKDNNAFNQEEIKLKTEDLNIYSNNLNQPSNDLPGLNGPPISASQSKESVFIRMINKIKSLELNLSLSSQYLEELSQRYRRQMDEMQKNFNQTIIILNETSEIAIRKDNKQQLLLDELNLKIADLENKLFYLILFIFVKILIFFITWFRN